MKTASVRLACVLALLAIGASRSFAEEITFERRVAPGDTWSIDEDITLEIELTVSSQGRAAQTLRQTTRRVRTGEVEVVKAADGRAESVKAAYGAECADTVKEGDGEAARTAAGMAGQSVTVKRKKDGEASVKCAGELTDAEKAEARALLDGIAGHLPKKTVKKGDRWSAGEGALPAALRQMLEISAGDACKARFTLGDTADLDGRRVAGVEVKVTSERKAAAATTKVELAGTYVVDVASGLAIAAELHGTMTVTGEFEQDDGSGKAVTVTLSGGGKVRYRGGRETFAAAANPAAGSFGRMRFATPPGWKATAYSDGVRLQPERLPEGGHLDVTVMPAIEWSGSLAEALKRSWDDAAAMLGLEKTWTVNRTEYVTRQSGTSFRGWEYIRGDGTMRKDGDFYVHVFVVKLRGRAERICIASRVPPGIGAVPTYQHLNFHEAVQEFLFGITFEDWTDAVVEPATLKGGGIVGVWAGVSMVNGTFDGTYALFFSNGQAYFSTKLPRKGLDGLDSWVARELDPRSWGTWTFADGEGAMKLIYQDVPIRADGEALVLTTLKTDHRFVRMAPHDGARFDGTWAFAPEAGKKAAAITFTPGGEFTDDGALTVLNHEYPLVVAPGSGTYEIRNYTMILRFKDGRELRLAFAGWGLTKGDRKPAKLSLSSNDDTLLRQ